MAKLFSDLPPWAIPAGAGIAVLMLLSRSRDGGSGGGYGQVMAYEPVPADPGLVQLSLAETGARSQGFGDLVRLVTGRELATIGAERDVTLAREGYSTELSLAELQAGVARTALAAEERIHIARDATARYMTDAQFEAENKRLRAETGIRSEQLGLQRYQASTERYAARRNFVTDTIGAVANVVTKIFPWNW
jgi:hypothetical protein